MVHGRRVSRGPSALTGVRTEARGVEAAAFLSVELNVEVKVSAVFFLSRKSVDLTPGSLRGLARPA